MLLAKLTEPTGLDWLAGLHGLAGLAGMAGLLGWLGGYKKVFVDGF